MSLCLMLGVSPGREVQSSRPGHLRRLPQVAFPATRNKSGTLFPVAACAAPVVTGGDLEKMGRDSRPSHWTVLMAQCPALQRVPDHPAGRLPRVFGPRPRAWSQVMV